MSKPEFSCDLERRWSEVDPRMESLDYDAEVARYGAADRWDDEPWDDEPDEGPGEDWEPEHDDADDGPYERPEWTEWETPF